MRAWRVGVWHSLDNALKLWDARTGALIRTFDGHSDGVCCRWCPRLVGQPGQHDQAVGHRDRSADAHAK
jgi:hypothetical protein